MIDAIYNEVYNKTEIDTLLENIDLSNYYDKTEVDTLLTNTNLTASENIDITNNQISLTFPLKVNGEIVMNPRAYGIQFELYAATSGFAFLQNQQDGAQPRAIFNSLDKSVEFFGDLDIPNFYNKTEINSMLTGGSADLSNYYTKNEITGIVTDINNNHYTKAEVDDIDNELTTLILNTYTKTEIDTTLMTTYVSVAVLNNNFYDKTYLDNQFTSFPTIGYLNEHYKNSVEISNEYYDKTYLDNQFTNFATLSYLHEQYKNSV
jgi:type II secretory pathway pseudopilin PulG